MICLRCSGVMGRSGCAAGRPCARSTMPGVPFSSRKETSASPTRELGDHLVDIELRVGAEGLGGGFDGFLIARREGAEGVLHTVAELAEDDLGTSMRVLGDEVDADALGADEAHDLLDRRLQDGGQSLKSRWASSKKKTSLGFSGSPTSGSFSKSSRQQPEQERGVELRRLDAACRRRGC